MPIFRAFFGGLAQLVDVGEILTKIILYDQWQTRRNCKHEKTLTAICATFLLAAPIQFASAAANTSEENAVQPSTNCNVSYYKWSNHHKWSIKQPQPSTPSKEVPNATQPSTPSKEVPNTTQPTPPATTTPSTDVNAFEQEVVTLTNAERTKAGLSPLQTDAPLMAAAREKSQDMQKISISLIQAQHSVHHLTA